jgi:hypothetical protein
VDQLFEQFGEAGRQPDRASGGRRLRGVEAPVVVHCLLDVHDRCLAAEPYGPYVQGEEFSEAHSGAQRGLDEAADLVGAGVEQDLGFFGGEEVCPVRREPGQAVAAVSLWPVEGLSGR